MSSSHSGFKATIDWYEDHAEEYAAQIADTSEHTFIDRFIEKLGKGAKVLDAGCAGGRDCRIFKDAGLIPVGLDITHSLIEVAKQKNPDIDFQQGSFLSIPFSENSFDGVWANASLVHLEKMSEVRKSVEEFFRVLKPKGKLHISVKQQTGEEKTIQAAHAFSGDFKRFFHLFTKDEIEQILKDVGFKILDLQANYNSSEKRTIQWIVVLAEKI